VGRPVAPGQSVPGGTEVAVVTNLEKRARLFAIRWHDSIGQVRKYTYEPYWKHPVAVAELVKTVPHTPEMVSAAFCHDVIEDTPCTEAELRAELGGAVGDLVMWLTDISKPSDGNREVRKRIDRAHTAAAPREAKTVKLADLIDNSRSIIALDPDFAKVYLREKRLLLDEALGDGDPLLWAMADDIVRKATS
jgi:(p)ppGpp synthase/HD superfamily hydrolase